MTNLHTLEVSSQPNPFVLVFKEQIKSKPIKRAFDFLFSVGALLFFFPILVIVTLAIRITSRGKTVYSHERIGRGGKPFQCYKFRTMYVDADAKLKDLLASCPEMRKEWDHSYKLKNDPRVTPIGAFLRKTSLDELPQFWNVLKGELSIVGPRPVVKAELAKQYGSKAVKILSIKPGLTGLWQVSGRNDTSYANRIRMDEEYIDKQSLLFDIKLILKTIPAMVLSKGAY